MIRRCLWRLSAVESLALARSIEQHVQDLVLGTPQPLTLRQAARALVAGHRLKRSERALLLSVAAAAAAVASPSSMAAAAARRDGTSDAAGGEGGTSDGGGTGSTAEEAAVRSLDTLLHDMTTRHPHVELGECGRSVRQRLQRRHRNGGGAASANAAAAPAGARTDGHPRGGSSGGSDTTVVQATVVQATQLELAPSGAAPATTAAAASSRADPTAQGEQEDSYLLCPSLHRLLQQSILPGDSKKPPNLPPAFAFSAAPKPQPQPLSAAQRAALPKALWHVAPQGPPTYRDAVEQTIQRFAHGARHELHHQLCHPGSSKDLQEALGQHPHHRQALSIFDLYQHYLLLLRNGHFYECVLNKWHPASRLSAFRLRQMARLAARPLLHGFVLVPMPVRQVRELLMWDSTWQDAGGRKHVLRREFGSTLRCLQALCGSDAASSNRRRAEAAQASRRLARIMQTSGDATTVDGSDGACLDPSAAGAEDASAGRADEPTCRFFSVAARPVVARGALPCGSSSTAADPAAACDVEYEYVCGKSGQLRMLPPLPPLTSSSLSDPHLFQHLDMQVPLFPSSFLKGPAPKGPAAGAAAGAQGSDGEAARLDALLGRLSEAEESIYVFAASTDVLRRCILPMLAPLYVHCVCAATAANEARDVQRAEDDANDSGAVAAAAVSGGGGPYLPATVACDALLWSHHLGAATAQRFLREYVSMFPEFIDVVPASREDGSYGLVIRKL